MYFGAKIGQYSKVALLFIVIVVLFVGAYFGYQELQIQRKNEEVRSLLQQGNSLYSAGNYTETISISNKIIALASTPENIAQAEFLEANSLLQRNQVGDLQKGIMLYKNIALNSNVDSAIRANAYVRIAEILPSNSTNGAFTLKLVVFNSPPFDFYLAKEGGDVTKAVLALLQTSNQLNPTAFANYEMAFLQALQLHQQSLDPKNAAQLQVATSMRQEIAAGDKLLVSTGTSTLRLSQLQELDYQRAIALGAISYFFPDISSRTVDGAYEQALTTLRAANAISSDQIIFKLTYAASLHAREHGLADARIKELLSVFSMGGHANPSVDTYILSLRNLPATDNIRRQIPQLALISPEFSSYLKQIDW